MPRRASRAGRVGNAGKRSCHRRALPRRILSRDVRQPVLRPAVRKAVRGLGFRPESSRRDGSGGTALGGMALAMHSQPLSAIRGPPRPAGGTGRSRAGALGCTELAYLGPDMSTRARAVRAVRGPRPSVAIAAGAAGAARS